MSYDNRRSRRPLYAPPPPPPSRRQHSVLGYWVPLLVTGTIAIGGLAAWVWSERQDHDEDDHHGNYPSDKPSRPPQGGQYGPPPPSGPSGGPSGGGSTFGGPPPSYQGPLPSMNAGPQGQPPPAPQGGEAASYYGSGARDAQSHDQQQQQQNEDGTFFGQVRGAMRRTPSPQQFFDHASKHVSAGFAAAGSALGRIIEDPRDERPDGYGERDGFSDHERWSEEADEKVMANRSGVDLESEKRIDTARQDSVERQSRSGNGKERARKTVAVVVSADTNMDGKMDEEDVTDGEHASILSHLPPHHNPSTTSLFVLIYAPGLSSLPPLSYRPAEIYNTETASNLSASYSHINTPAQTPGSELQSISPRIAPTPSQSEAGDAKFESPGRQFDHLYASALSLVDSPSKILCFTTTSGFVPILRHLSPNLAYVSDLLAGPEGKTVSQLKGWVGQTVLVIGDDATGGLAETETEDEEGKKEERRWWEHSNLVGLGKGMEVVDAGRVGEDWGRRVGGRD